jgi:hypothetical protein
LKIIPADCAIIPTYSRNRMSSILLGNFTSAISRGILTTFLALQSSTPHSSPPKTTSTPRPAVFPFQVLYILESNCYVCYRTVNRHAPTRHRTTVEQLPSRKRQPRRSCMMRLSFWDRRIRISWRVRCTASRQSHTAGTRAETVPSPAPGPRLYSPRLSYSPTTEHYASGPGHHSRRQDAR